jgi:hypothetical protein
MSSISQRSLLAASAAGSVPAFSDLGLNAATSDGDAGFKLGVASYSLRSFREPKRSR